MNDLSQIMSHTPNPPQLMSQPPPKQIMSQTPNMMSQLPPKQIMNPVQPRIMNPNSNPIHHQRANYGNPWHKDHVNRMMFDNKGFFVPLKPRTNNWKGKNVKPENKNAAVLLSGGGAGYKPPSLNDLQNQNQIKARKYYHPKKKFNNNNTKPNRFAPYAPRNTTSFIIRAKKAGGIASLVSPCPVTPAVLPTPVFSPSREVLGDMVKEEWGVDGYGSMKGLIRLRSPTGEGGNEEEEDDEDEEGSGSSESDVEEHLEVERRLDHDLSRFEMIYPNCGEYGGVGGYSNILENRVDDQDSHIAQLEEENLTLKERLFLMEREVQDMRLRLQFLEKQQRQGRSCGAMAVEDANEEVVENLSENDENDSEGSDVAGASVSGGGMLNADADVCMEDAAVPGNGEEVRKDIVAHEDSSAPEHKVSKDTKGRLLEDEEACNLVKEKEG